MSRNKILILSGVIVGSIAVAGAGVYAYLSYHRAMNALRADLSQTKSDLAFVKAESENNYQSIENTLSGVQNSTSSLSDKLTTQEEISNDVAQRIGAVSSTVGTLQKLSQIDPELLKQYSKVYFLNEHYVPESLTTITASYVNPPTKQLQFLTPAYPFLSRLLDDAKSASLSLQLDSAYRSFGTQAVLKAAYRVTYGAGTANAFSAEQGYSEHQLGTAVDFTTPKIGGGLSGFDKTPEYAWLNANAYKYGFIISYPQNNPSYMFEPWHWRFVGVKLATDIHNQNTYFYNMDQRVIDTYLANIFDPMQ